MRHVVWIGIGWLGIVFWSALGARLDVGHVLPDCAVITVVFLASRREPIPLVLTSAILGYLVGRQSLAADGLHETALSLCAIGVYLLTDTLQGSGAVFFALLSGATVMGYHAVLFVLMYWVQGAAGFASWAAASLLPSAVATAAVALMSYPGMAWLERRMTAERREGLSWHS